MIKTIKSLIDNKYDFFYKLIFYIIFYYSCVTLYLTFDIAQSPDFEKYYKYFEYYSGKIDKTGLEQGNLYFFFHYIFAVAVSSSTNLLTINEIVNISVHLVNSIIFLFGIKGFIKILKFKKYKSSYIYLSMIVVCFLPPAIQLRLTLKPEIIAFSLFGWILFHMSKYLSTNNKIDILLFFLALSVLFTSKISISFILFVILALEMYTNHRKIFNRKNLKYILPFLILSCTLIIENRHHNGLFLNEVKHPENYNNKADLNFFSNINRKDLINNPNRYFHNESFISITLFDTFNDFFLIYWNSEYTELNKNRDKEFFKINKIPNNKGFLKVKFDSLEKSFTFSGDFDARWDDPNYINETRMRFSFIFSIFFYLLSLVLSFIRKNRIILISQFIGMLIIALSALGVFGTNNFDPKVGDSVKIYYISFLISLSFIFLIVELFRIFNFGYKTASIVFISLFMFFIGFPFSYAEDTRNDILYKNSLLTTCAINEPLIQNILGIDEEVDCKKNFNDDEIFIPITKMRSIEFNINISKIPIVSFLVFITYLSLLNNFISPYITNYFEKFKRKRKNG